MQIYYNSINRKFDIISASLWERTVKIFFLLFSYSPYTHITELSHHTLKMCWAHKQQIYTQPYNILSLMFLKINKLHPWYRHVSCVYNTSYSVKNWSTALSDWLCTEIICLIHLHWMILREIIWNGYGQTHSCYGGDPIAENVLPVRVLEYF